MPRDIGGARNSSKERQRIALPFVHQRDEAFELNTGDLAGEKADDVFATRLDSLDHFDGIAHQRK